MNTNLLDQCITSFQRVRGSMVSAMMDLAAVFAAKAWEEKYSSFGEFVENGLQISQSSASKMLKVHQAYLLSGTTKPEALEGIDLEKAYLAIPLLKDQSPREVLEQAKLLSRQELKETVHEAQNGPHTHQFDERRYGKCSVCKGYHLV